MLIKYNENKSLNDANNEEMSKLRIMVNFKFNYLLKEFPDVKYKVS